MLDICNYRRRQNNTANTENYSNYYCKSTMISLWNNTRKEESKQHKAMRDKGVGMDFVSGLVLVRGVRKCYGRYEGRKVR